MLNLYELGKPWTCLRQKIQKTKVGQKNILTSMAENLQLTTKAFYPLVKNSPVKALLM